MLSFKPTYTIPSSIQTGVSFTVKRLSAIDRANRELENADAFDALAQIQRDHSRLPKAVVIKEFREGNEVEIDTYPNDTPEESDRRAALNTRFKRLLNAKIYPIVFESALQAVSGFESVEAFISAASDELLSEAYICCEAASRLTAEQLGNLESPGTSSEAVAGQSEISIVTTASKAA
jgi:hypothetical protein